MNARSHTYSSTTSQPQGEIACLQTPVNAAGKQFQDLISCAISSGTSVQQNMLSANDLITRPPLFLTKKLNQSTFLNSLNNVDLKSIGFVLEATSNVIDLLIKQKYQATIGLYAALLNEIFERASATYLNGTEVTFQQYFLFFGWLANNLTNANSQLLSKIEGYSNWYELAHVIFKKHEDIRVPERFFAEPVITESLDYNLTRSEVLALRGAAIFFERVDANFDSP